MAATELNDIESTIVIRIHSNKTWHFCSSFTTPSPPLRDIFLFLITELKSNLPWAAFKQCFKMQIKSVSHFPGVTLNVTYYLNGPYIPRNFEVKPSYKDLQQNPKFVTMIHNSCSEVTLNKIAKWDPKIMVAIGRWWLVPQVFIYLMYAFEYVIFYLPI